MSDRFYRVIRFVGAHIFWASGRPIVIGLEHIPKAGACILASNHTSPYDVAVLIRHCPRLLDFVSITEVFRNPVVGWFYGSMNAFPLNRHKPDAPTVRIIFNRLSRGRVVAMFPEGGFRRGDASVVRGGTIRPGIGRIAHRAGVPVIPVVLINTSAYCKPLAWMPLFKTRYALALGPPIASGLTPEQIETAVVESLKRLYLVLIPLLPQDCRTL